jgi:hypothetical protein
MYQGKTYLAGHLHQRDLKRYDGTVGYQPWWPPVFVTGWYKWKPLDEAVDAHNELGFNNGLVCISWMGQETDPTNGEDDGESYYIISHFIPKTQTQ